MSALTDYHRLELAVAAVDRRGEPAPTLMVATGWLLTPLPYFGPCQHWIARDDRSVIGRIQVGFPADENDTLAVTEVVVHPEARGQGVENELMRAALPTIRQERRTVVSFQGLTESSSTDQWARGLAFAVVHRDLLLRLDLITTDRRAWDVAVPDGYQIQRWVGAAPERVLPSYSRVRTAIGDQPQHDWSVRWPRWTPSRIRQEEEDFRQQRVQLLVVAAVLEATGDVVGVTEILLYPHRPGRGVQGHTAVLPEHRGHGLGLLVKSRMMRWLTDDWPAVTEALASNADDNVYMVGINRRLGYSVVRRMVSLEKGVAELAAVL